MRPILEDRPAVALTWNDEQVSYGELLRRAWSWSRQLTDAGERVAILSENRLEWAMAAYAVWAAGKAIVPIDALSSAEEVAYLLDDCTPGLVYCSKTTRPTLERALGMAGHRPTVLDLEDASSRAASEAAGAPREPILADESSLAAIVYTSGTTGNPKGVMVTWGNLFANVVAVADAGFFTPQTRVLLLLPLHHVLPLAGALVAPLFAGGVIVFATSLAGEQLVATLRENRVTTIVGVPRFYDLLHRALRERIDANVIARGLFALAGRLGSKAFSRLVFGSVHRKLGGHLRHLISGGAALGDETARTFQVLGFDVCQGYGMTECAPMITFPRLGRIKIGSCGQALTGCEVAIQEGEIVAHGPNVMRGYYGRPDETAAILRDGWLHTGDLGRLDEQGFLYVTGRLKEIVVLPSGKKVNPLTVEAALAAASPAVKEAGVFLDGEVLHALVVPDWNALPIADRHEAEAWLRREVLEPYNATVAPYRRVARVTLANEDLPRTRLAKLRRHLLAGIAEQMADRSASVASGSTTGDDTLARLTAFLARQCRRPVQADSRIEADLGVDSLGRVELSVFLERAFGVSVSETRLSEFETVSALAGFVSQYQTARDSALDVSWAEILAPKRPPALPGSSLWHRGIILRSRAFVRLYFRARARGMERLPDEPCILAPNHQSFIDGLFVTAFMRPRAVLRTFFYAKEKHVRQWWLRYLAQRNNVVVMKSDEGIRSSLQKLAAALRRGHNVMIFPEGTRSASGTLGDFRETYAILARELRVPVVPVVIDGAHQALPSGRLWPKLLGRISVTYLDPVRPREGEDVQTFNGRVRSLIQERLLLGRGQA